MRVLALNIKIESAAPTAQKTMRKLKLQSFIWKKFWKLINMLFMSGKRKILRATYK